MRVALRAPTLSASALSLLRSNKLTVDPCGIKAHSYQLLLVARHLELVKCYAQLIDEDRADRRSTDALTSCWAETRGALRQQKVSLDVRRVHDALAVSIDELHKSYMASTLVGSSARSVLRRCDRAQLVPFRRLVSMSGTPAASSAKTPTLVMQIIVRRDLQTVRSVAVIDLDQLAADEIGAQLADWSTDGSSSARSDGRH